MNGDSKLGVILGNGDGTFQTAATFTVADVPAAITAADLNGDGKADLVIADACSLDPPLGARV